MIKQIGILNFQYSEHNYGAVLQAAALEFELKEQGYDAEHINYIPKSNITFKSRLKKVLIKSKILRVRSSENLLGKEVFEKFRNDFITRSKKVENENEFYQLSKEYKSVVVGSDQVWRSKMVSDLAIYFLKYVPDHVQRISYAASFGAAEWELSKNAPLTLMAKDQAKKFKAISCRESSGVKICNEVFDVLATHVLDPLLLVSDKFIEKLIKSSKPSLHKMVYYKLGTDRSFSEELVGLEKTYNAKARNIYTRSNNEHKYEEVSQWVRNIYDSDIVITDSFHCICLGLRFNKTVIYYPNPERGQARLDDLFNMFNVNLVKHTDNNLSSFLLEKDDTEFFDRTLFSMREKSLAFIKVSLKY